VGDEVGHFRLVETVSSDAFGPVWLACHTSSGDLALVHISGRPAAHAARSAEWETAMEAARRLVHPCIAPTLGFGALKPGMHLWYAEPYRQTGSIQGLIDVHGPLLWNRASLIVHAVAEGVQHALGRGVVHGRLSAATVYLSAAGEVRITEYGVSAALGTLSAELPLDPGTDARSVATLAEHLVFGHAALADRTPNLPPPYRALIDLARSAAPPQLGDVLTHVRSLVRLTGADNREAALRQLASELEFYFLVDGSLPPPAQPPPLLSEPPPYQAPVAAAPSAAPAFDADADTVEVDAPPTLIAAPPLRAAPSLEPVDAERPEDVATRIHARRSPARAQSAVTKATSLAPLPPVSPRRRRFGFAIGAAVALGLAGLGGMYFGTPWLRAKVTAPTNPASPAAPLSPGAPSEPAAERTAHANSAKAEPEVVAARAPIEPVGSTARHDPEAAAPTTPASPPSAAPLAEQGRRVEEENPAKFDVAISPSYRAGLLALSEKRYPDAVEALLDAKAQEGGNAEVLRALGQAFERQRQFARAAEEYRAALSVAPLDAEAAWGLVRTLDRSGRARLAKRAVEESVEGAHKALVLGEAELRARNFAGARAIFTEYAARFPHDWRGWFGLGNAELRALRLSEAQQAFGRAHASEPTQRAPSHNLALVQLRLGQAEKAEATLRDVAARFPLDWRSRCELAKLLAQGKREPEALGLIEEIAKLAPQHPVATRFVRSGRAESPATILAMAGDCAVPPDYTSLDPTQDLAAPPESP
jgi:tetratricopeptide (TPR) repeat protein